METTKKVLVWTYYVLLTLFAFLTVASIVVPAIGDATPRLVISGSMEPTIMTGDLVVSKNLDEEERKKLRVNDVITFQPEKENPALVTHRIVQKSASSAGVSYVTKGDANDVNDAEVVQSGQVVGKYWYHIAKVGRLANFFDENRLKASIGFIVLGALLIGTGFAGKREKKGESSNELAE